MQEEELKKEGGKYAHLNEELHVLVEVYSEISDAYARLSHALSELAKFLSPVSTYKWNRSLLKKMKYILIFYILPIYYLKIKIFIYQQLLVMV